MKRIASWMIAVLTCTVLLAGCTSPSPGATDKKLQEQTADTETEPVNDEQTFTAAEQPSRVYYEIFVRSFYDTNGDGIGDLNGVTEKLDYLSDLGVQGIWLMPVNPSPSYHGYDVTDYYGINPDYGTIEDMKRLVEEAHKRDIKVIMDLVVNHSSVEHPWFVDSAKGVDSPKRDWYTWAEEGTSATGASATGAAKAWHSKNGSHYLGVFWDGMPDLNLDNPEVREEMIAVGKHWLGLGVDGFRLDAAKHIYEDLQNDRADPQTGEKNVAWWQEFRKAMEESDPDVVMIGEVWDSPVVVAPYFNHAMSSAFNFDLSKRIIDMVKAESRSNLAFSMNRVYSLYRQSSGGSFTDSIFLANHDQNRVMSVFNGNEDHARTAASVLLTLPGNPFLYYGEEIGMTGAKPDEYIREPFRWTNDRKAAGNTSWIVPKYNRDESASVEELMSDPNSLLSHYKRLIEYRNGDRAMNEGGIVEFKLDNSEVESYIRATSDGEASLVIHNLGKKPAEVDITTVKGGEAFKNVAFSTSEETGLKENGLLTLPAYTTTILKK